MMRIALGSDHRGGKIARAILSEVLFPEHYTEAQIPGDDFRTPFVGACLVSGEMSPTKGFIGRTMENLLEKIPREGGDEEGPSTIFSLRATHLRVDYPEIAAAVAERVADGGADVGILVCGTGIGMSIVANKFFGVRAAIGFNELTAEMSRHHNDANILCLPGEMLGVPSAITLVRKWLTSGFDGGRHRARLDKIAVIERKTGL